MTNPYCDPLGISVPRLERLKDHPSATTFSLLIVALLERGAPMTLVEVAERFEQRTYVVGEDGQVIDDADIQLARIVTVVH
jgi:hypothetical protein